VSDEAESEGVEGGEYEAACVFIADQSLDTFPHFGSGFVGEGDGQDSLGCDSCGEDVSDPMRDYSCFPAASASQYKEGAVDRRHRFELRWIEFAKVIGHGKYQLG